MADFSLPKFLGVNLVTPRGVLAHEDTDTLVAPGEQGEFELLPGHLPMLTMLRPGVLVIGRKHTYAVSSGYLRIDAANLVEILVEQAVAGSEVDTAAATAELKAAEADLAKWGDKPTDGEWVTLQQNLQWARAKLAAASA